ncbi:MAG TPA: permease prefix domain 1-containing protein [Candidatus Binatia bacterium]|nr:permease prefix domain 1-containing protein [Candidatus Binatia bacterium]
MSATTVAALLAELGRELPPDLPGRARILAEVEDHLVQSAERLIAGGLPRAAAEREALARFGEPAQLAILFRSLAQPGGVLDLREEPLAGWQRAASLAAVAAGAFAAVGLIALAGWSMLDPDLTTGQVPRALGLLAAALLAATVSGMLLMRRRLDLDGRLQISALGSLALVLIGAASVLATLQIGEATGDYEWYGAGIGLALIAQGALAAWLLRVRRRAAS